MSVARQPSVPGSFPPYDRPLTLWQRLSIGVVVSGLLGLGVLVEVRSAFLQRHMTDLGVYLRAAWAVRAGDDLYAITDDNGWHYHYPPLLAIALVPLADPPAGADGQGVLPFAFSVALWYVFSLICLAAAVHELAGALEQTNTGAAPPAGSRRWWALRVLPVLICLPAIGHTLARGQVNLLLLWLLCGFTAAVLRRQSARAGAWLAAAICLKVIPAFLLVYPVWRRDLRFLAGTAGGLVAGLVLIPALVFGPTRTWNYFQEWDRALRAPALAAGTDQSRAKELIEVTATDSQSFLAMIHNTLHLDRNARPHQASARVKAVSWIVSLVLTALTLLIAGQSRQRSAPQEVILLGSLFLMMVLTSPVGHLHYFSLLLPLVMGMLAFIWQTPRSRRVEFGWRVFFGLVVVAMIIPHLPGMELTRDIGLASYGALSLWLGALLLMRAQQSPDASVALPGLPEAA
jgi:alpha-1,2-mannosyltransferase